jgi:uncharacterized protein (TIGR02757 family)
MKPLEENELKEFLEEKVLLYNHSGFIERDPVLVPHRFTEPCDMEIAAFLTASIAWGNRASIIRNALRLMTLMDNAPCSFVMDATEKDLLVFNGFVHRTFLPPDCEFFIRSLHNIYRNHGGLGGVFQREFQKKQGIEQVLVAFRNVFFEVPHRDRSQKHVSDILRGSAAKRLNLFLRWMVRQDPAGVDFGLWKGIPMSHLFLPLDIHSGNVARKLGLLKTRQNNWKAVREVTENLIRFDPADPVKYDYALFGLGVFEKF